MIFNTAWFLLFFLVFYPLFWVMPNPKIRFYFVLASSAVFHFHFAGPAGMAPIILMAVLTYFFALWLERIPPEDRRRQWVFLASLVVPISGLVAYKYRALLLSTLASFLPGSAAGWLEAHAVQPALPLAVSFFTFEFVHYLTDVFHGSKAVRNPFHFSLFCIFFPSLVSGPIKRFQPFLSQVREGIPRPRFEGLIQGLFRVLLGFFKKLLIADNATLVIHLLEKHASHSPLCVVSLMALLSVRILFDFSGYSDIAIGLAKMANLELPENFNYPYIAASITDFWRRWHMSLSTWIRDYIYVPLGGNRHGPLRKLFNLLVTMFVCGLWHGAAWHFGVWGVWQGLGLTAHNLWEKWRGGSSTSSWGRRLLGMVLTNAFVAYGWLLFFYPMEDVVQYTKTLLAF